MEAKEVLSIHKLTTDYSQKNKMKTLATQWSIFLIIFGVTRLSFVQQGMIDFAQLVTVTWVTSIVNFICNGLWLIFIPMVLGSVLLLRENKPFDEIVLYTNGIEFINGSEREKKFVPYGDIQVSYGKMRASVCFHAPIIHLKESEHIWENFTETDLLQSNLIKYAALK